MEGRLNRVANVGLSAVLLTGSLSACKGSALDPDRTPNILQFRPCAAGATPHPEVSPDPSMNFCLTNFGFSFKYPSFLYTRELSEPNILSFMENGAQRLLVEIEQSDLPLSEYAKKKTPPGDYPTTEEPLTIDGREALALVMTTSMQQFCGRGTDAEIKRTNYLFIKDGQRIIDFIINHSCDSVGTDWFSKIPPTIHFTQ